MLMLSIFKLTCWYSAFPTWNLIDTICWIHSLNSANISSKAMFFSSQLNVFKWGKGDFSELNSSFHSIVHTITWRAWNIDNNNKKKWVKNVAIRVIYGSIWNFKFNGLYMIQHRDIAKGCPDMFKLASYVWHAQTSDWILNLNTNEWYSSFSVTAFLNFFYAALRSRFMWFLLHMYTEHSAMRTHMRMRLIDFINR